ncbi:MAG: TIGR04211 family SH3 domain-containing protein [Proteobacteria bacterium]|nr:TIGR04211 family SH3 domain-containing protein [Pseudomonadota bacterium]
MIFPVSNFCRKVGLLFFLLPLIPVNSQAETVYITDSLLVGLHEEKSIDSPILKVLPTGTTLEVIKRDNDFVHVRDPKGVSGWISNNYLTTNNPDKNEGMDERTAQSKIRELEAELQNIKIQQAKPDQDLVINSDEIAKLKIENKNLKQKIKSDKLKSGELQANLAELRNQISQAGNNNKLSSKIQLLTEKNAGLKDEIKRLHNGSNTEVSEPNTSSLSNLVIGSGIVLLAGLLLGILLMDWLQRRRHGGLRY